MNFQTKLEWSVPGIYSTYGYWYLVPYLNQVIDGMGLLSQVDFLAGINDPFTFGYAVPPLLRPTGNS